MTRVRWSLRLRLAVLGFGAIYLPGLLLFGVILATDTEVTSQWRNGVETARTTSTHRSAWPTLTLLALAPLAAASAWWWAGRAVRPIERIQTVIDQIAQSDLSRRIGLTRGAVEIVSLAASFDRMLDRLERAAHTQPRLIEEASHELRIPLSVLVTNAEVLLAHPEPTLEIYRQGLERSRRSAVRLQATLDELLRDARGRARTIARQPADLMHIVRSVVADAAVLAAASQITLTVAGPPTAVAPVDAPTVTRAVANLVGNAIRYAPSGSSVEVEVAVVGAELLVAVTDHGPGIPPEHQRWIFHRRWRGRPEVPGTGLGLPIAHQIAEAHAGTLTVTSPGPTGDGCVFRLSLPR